MSHAKTMIPAMNLEAVDVSHDPKRFRLKTKSDGLGKSKAMLKVDATGFRLQQTRFTADEMTYVPFSMIASTVYVVAKPWYLLVIGLITLPLIVGLFFLIGYFVAKKQIIVGVVSAGGNVEALKVKAKGASLEEIRAGMKVLDDLLQKGSAPDEPPTLSPSAHF